MIIGDQKMTIKMNLLRRILGLTNNNRSIAWIWYMSFCVKYIHIIKSDIHACKWTRIVSYCNYYIDYNSFVKCVYNSNCINSMSYMYWISYDVRLGFLI